MFGIIAGLAVALAFAIGGGRIALNIRGAATSMTRRYEENVALRAQAQGVLGAPSFTWPPAFFRCVAALVGLLGTVGVLLAVGFLIASIA